MHNSDQFNTSYLTVGLQKDMVYGTLCRSLLLYNSPYLIVNSIVSYLTKKGKRWSREDLSYWLSTLANFQNQYFMQTQVQRRGRVVVRAELMSLNRHFIEHRQPFD